MLGFNFSFTLFLFSYFNLSPSKTSIKALQAKIIGGIPVSIEKFPSAIMFFNKAGMCSATVLNSWTVVTTAHCFEHNQDTEEMVLLAGARYIYDYAAAVYQVSQFKIHENYNQEMRFACDIALVFVRTSIAFGNTVKKAVIVNHGKWMNENNKDFHVAGWGQIKYGGQISSQGLMTVTLRYIPLKQCGRLHKLNLTPDMFCLYGDGVQDSCKGDSGSGVLWNSLLVGLVSHGDGCGNVGKPGVYVNLWHFRKWIQNTIMHYVRTNCQQNKTVDLA